MGKQDENLGSFFKENTKLAKEYFETMMEIYRLRAIRLLSRSTGYFIWLMISLFLFFLLMIFLGIVIGLWISDLTGSYIAGFGITTAVIVLVIIMLALARKSLFVNQIIKIFIRQSNDTAQEEE